MRAFFAGIGMGLLALVTRSILPGMVLHSLIDVGSGCICYMAVRGSGDSSEVTASAAGAAGAA